MAKKKAAKKVSQPPSFEEALKRLEEIVRLLEEGDVGLNEALAQYEEGVKLLRQSYDLLQRAERRIELLSGVDADGNPICEPFDDRATLPQEGQPPKQPPHRKGSADDCGNPQAGQNDMDAPGRLF